MDFSLSPEHKRASPKLNTSPSSKTNHQTNTKIEQPILNSKSYKKSEFFSFSLWIQQGLGNRKIENRKKKKNNRTAIPIPNSFYISNTNNHLYSTVYLHINHFSSFFQILYLINVFFLQAYCFLITSLHVPPFNSVIL